MQHGGCSKAIWVTIFSIFKMLFLLHWAARLGERKGGGQRAHAEHLQRRTRKQTKSSAPLSYANPPLQNPFTPFPESYIWEHGFAGLICSVP